MSSLILFQVMEGIMLRLYFYLFLTVIGNVCPSCPLVTCRTTASVSEGEASRVACFFVHDLRANKTDFRITHYAQASSKKPDNVLDCTYDGNRANPSCRTASGYTFDGVFGTQVTLTIPLTTKDKEGTYVCESGIPDPEHSRTCSLKVHEARVNPKEKQHPRCQTKTPVTEGKSTFIECEFPEDPKENKHNFGVLRYDTSPNDTLPEQVMDCTWNTDGDQPVCHTHLGYSFDNNVGKRLTLAIPKATVIHAGTYACYESRVPTANSSCCALVVQDIAQSARQTKCETNDDGQTASVTCVFPHDLLSYADGFGIDHYDTFKNGSVIPLSKPTIQCVNVSQCVTAKGYEHVSGKNSSHITVKITDRNAHHLRKYSCKVMAGHSEIKLQNCSLTLSSEGTEDKNLAFKIAVPVVVVMVGVVLVLVVPKIRRCILARRGRL